jgi:hypothetical protein
LRGYVKQLERKLEAAEARLRSYEQHERNHQNIVPDAIPSQANTSILLTDRISGARLRVVPENSCHISSSSPMLGPLPEVMDINIATKRFEFHGTSSIIAALDRIVQLRSDIIMKSPTSDITLAARSISSVTDFQNDSFMLQAHKPLLLSMSFNDDEYFSMYALPFIDSYFMGLHYIHPLIDHDFFLKRCYDLWYGDTSKLRASFRLQYYAVLALGAATRTWTEGLINGLSQAEWTQLLISKAEQTMTETGYQMDFEGGQAMFILAQVHLQSLSYNTAYTYLGNAIRIAHSGSVHRQMRQEDSKVPVDSPTNIISRFWWSLYSQEIELSFLLGRPDGLGNESFATRELPPVSQGSELNFTSAMLGISRALREIATNIYHGGGDLTVMRTKVSTIERNLDSSLAQALSYIRGFNDATGHSTATTASGDIFWVPWQICMLNIRKHLICPYRCRLITIGYLHAKVALYYPFFLHCEQSKQCSSTEPYIAMVASKCIETSRQLIREVFRAYKTHMFQRTW